MCKSVPQIEATLTLTRTSVRPNPGTLTSRTSAPGSCRLDDSEHGGWHDGCSMKFKSTTKRMILAPGVHHKRGVVSGLILCRHPAGYNRLRCELAQLRRVLTRPFV